MSLRMHVLRDLMSKVFHGNLPQPFEHPSSGQKVHLLKEGNKLIHEVYSIVLWRIKLYKSKQENHIGSIRNNKVVPAISRFSWTSVSVTHKTSPGKIFKSARQSDSPEITVEPLWST